MMAEWIGSFCFVFFFLSQTEEKTVISSIETVHCFVLAASYIAARSVVRGNQIGVSFVKGGNETYDITAGFTNYGACLNPAIAIGIFFASWFNSFGSAWEFVWLFPCFPFLGCVCAVFFFEFIYKKTQVMLNEHADEEPAVTNLERAIDEAVDVDVK